MYSTEATNAELMKTKSTRSPLELPAFFMKSADAKKTYGLRLIEEYDDERTFRTIFLHNRCLQDFRELRYDVVHRIQWRERADSA